MMMMVIVIALTSHLAVPKLFTYVITCCWKSRVDVQSGLMSLIC